MVAWYMLSLCFCVCLSVFVVSVICRYCIETFPYCKPFEVLNYVFVVRHAVTLHLQSFLLVTLANNNFVLSTVCK